ncbi:glycosyltransferase family A protein [uncultured Jannaschia sp.]|uniref:glycosyltransferase n=1 Tax=uncultured Jannaschia sp. TaxID=293347 RepID=UPI0026096D16|nr:glycosyltransferase family A protein [uncultured Jannaschia sp.]
MNVPRGWGRTGFVVVIPARNEAERLPHAFAALAGEGALDIVVVANGCVDGTSAIAREGRTPLRVATIETDPLTGGVGAARRMGMTLALERASAPILATTDADCRVRPGWLAATRTALERADAVCGYVEPDATEFGALPPLVREHGTLEDLRDGLRAHLAALQAPAPHNPLPCHGQTPGASLAFTARAYRMAGGFEAIPCHEDRRLIARMAAMGLRVARPATVRVAASCRLEGRAPGGMAATIAARRDDAPRLHREIADMTQEIAALRRAIAKACAADRTWGDSLPAA